jgi:hypothetical protein
MTHVWRPRLIAVIMAVVLIVATAGSLTAQSGLRSHVSLDAHEVAGGTSSYDNWSTPWGSYDRVTAGSKTVEIFTRNFGNAAATPSVTIYFVSNGIEVGRATHDFKFAGPGEIKTKVDAPQTVARTLNLPSISYSRTEGTVPITNWFVIGRCEGQIFAFKGSNPSCQRELEQKIKSGEIK